MTLPALISTSPELDHALRESHKRPVVVFKHGTRCGISAHAYQAYRSYVERQKGHDPLHVVIEVPEYRAISNDFASRTGIRHETPQVVVLSAGEAVWSASHWDISDEAIDAALGNLAN